MAQQRKRQPSRFKDAGFVHTKDGPKKLDPNTGLTQGMVGMLNAKKRDAEKANRKYDNHMKTREKSKQVDADLEEYRATLQGPSVGAERGPQPTEDTTPIVVPALTSSEGQVGVAGRKKRRLGVTRGPARKGKLARRRAGPEED